MKLERLIIKNTAFLAAGKGLGDLCTLIFLVYFARMFGTRPSRAVQLRNVGRVD